VGPIEPGTSGKIHVEINTTHLHDSYKKDIDVTTNDPDKGSFVLTVHATIMEILSIDPQYINFGRLPARSEKPLPIKVTNRSKGDVKITAIDVSPKVNLAISPSKDIIVKPGKTIELLLKLTTGIDPRIFQGTVLIKTDNPNLPEKIIQVRAEVLAK
jgi:hypothetical protein